VRRFGADLQRIAHRKLLLLDAAETINDLRIPPGNRLEQLRGDRSGQHKVRGSGATSGPSGELCRINDQWRVCFRWDPAGPSQVEIADYH